MEESVTLVKLSSELDERFKLLMKLYITAFPEEERRSEKSLIEMLGNKYMTFFSIYDGDVLAGLLVIWVFDDFRYIEYLAIFEDKRSRSIGSRSLQKIVHMSDKPIFLEVEQPVDTISRKRIVFYQHNGFHILKMKYYQPPYREGNPFFPLLLMSNEPTDSMDLQRNVVKTICENVYLLPFEDYCKLTQID